jgi:hypothetical protein
MKKLKSHPFGTAVIQLEFYNCENYATVEDKHKLLLGMHETSACLCADLTLWPTVTNT